MNAQMARAVTTAVVMSFQRRFLYMGYVLALSWTTGSWP